MVLNILQIQIEIQLYPKKIGFIIKKSNRYKLMKLITYFRNSLYLNSLSTVQEVVKLGSQKTLNLNLLSHEPSNRALCLNNTVQVDDSIKKANYSEIGQIWNANDQCKRLFGNSAYFCQTKSAQMCNYLYCKENISVEVCKSAGPAAEGTACQSGKLCTNGFCQISSLALEGCIFGDFEVHDSEVELTLDRLTDTCQNVTGILKCCETCQKYYSDKN
ncbi:ADAM family mig-17-like [Brachionus plicatilis]|uniref:ADAM family mig-17-like n=1 Tax=Brachionus plicatilis TaxID=10195 RepID=A0A3M7PCL0_BRAPC|nr:ADAM family mig-17-like [Brachionus plicatilis]